MAALHFQSVCSTIPSISSSSSNRRNKLPQSSCCFTFIRLGLQSSPNRFSFRLKDSVTMLLLSKTLIPANASNSDSSETRPDNVSKDSEPYAAAGPPFLTILAGILVFIAVCWAFGSIVVWLLSLIVKVPPSSSTLK